ncbi:MAG: FHA domain-containing protein, partial [Planctomycetota bacterium]
MARIVSNSDATEFSRYDLIAEGEIIIGRHPECEIIVEVGAVSRRHAKIIGSNGSFFVEDMKSRNGTFLNGQLVSGRMPLTAGDSLRICDVDLLFQDDLAVGVDAGTQMTFDGTQFGVMMVDDVDKPTDLSNSGIDFRSSATSGVTVTASAEAKLQAMIEIGKTLGQALKLDEVLPRVLDALFNIFPQADRGFVVLQDEASDALIPRWVKSRHAGGNDEMVRISRTIIREAMAKGALHSMDAANDGRFDASQSIADFRIRSLICAPLLNSEGVPFGALQIDTTSNQGQFAAEDVDLLSSVATQAATVIRNAQLHEQALQQREVEQDLKLATEVQQAFLPQAPLEIPGWRV